MRKRRKSERGGFGGVHPLLCPLPSRERRKLRHNTLHILVCFPYSERRTMPSTTTYDESSATVSSELQSFLAAEEPPSSLLSAPLW